MKTCDVCGKNYDFSMRKTLSKGEWYCLHDSSSIGRYEPSYIKKQREEYATDILQPRNPDGGLNKDFVKVYGKPEFATDTEMRELETRSPNKK